MHPFDVSLTLEQLLSYCSDRNNKYYEAAWREFLHRYKRFIYNLIIKTCQRYQAPRLKLQLSDTVNDIFDDVMEILTKDDHKALKGIRAGNNERQFLSWLAVTTNYAASAHIKKHFRPWIMESPPEECGKYTQTLASSDLWILYEDMVEDIRGMAKQDRKYLERDINVFMMYKWRQLPQPAIRSLPCLKGIGDRVIEVSTSRIVKFLKKLGKY